MVLRACRLTSSLFQRAEGKEEQPVGADPAQQLPSPGRSALLHNHQQEPHGQGQEENIPSVVRPSCFWRVGVVTKMTCARVVPVSSCNAAIHPQLTKDLQVINMEVLS